MVLQGKENYGIIRGKFEEKRKKFKFFRLNKYFFCACSVKVYNIKIWWIHVKRDIYSKTLNNEYIERIDQMSYSSLSGNGMLQIFSFLIKWLYGTV